MTDLNIRQVEAFKATMEAGSVTAAARRMNLTQPSVTKHLKLLQASLGVSLFDRTGNKLIPTAEGRAFYDQIERTYLGLDHLSRFADDLRNHRQGEIVMAAMPLIAHSWLPDIASRFLTEFSEISMSLPVRSSKWIIESVAAGRVDFGIGLSSGGDSAVLQKLLMNVPLVCAYPAGHWFAELEEVDSSQLGGETLISLSNFDQWRLAIESALDDQHVEPRRRVDTFTTYTACELVSRGVGIAIVDIVTALKYEGHDLGWAPFRPNLSFEIFLMRPRHWRVPRLAEKFIEWIESHAAETTSSIRQVLGDHRATDG